MDVIIPDDEVDLIVGDGDVDRRNVALVHVVMAFQRSSRPPRKQIVT
jgi:hypothetical protein